MDKSSNKFSYIITLGTTYSGSGAVYDYLSGRGDMFDPLKGIEYQLPQMPNGLMALEAVAGNAFHPATADYMISEFEKIVNKLGRSKTFWRYGKNYSKMIPLFQSASEEFLHEISVAKFSMRWHWRRLMDNKTTLMFVLNKFLKRLGYEDKISNTRLIVDREKFVDVAKKFHDKIFLSRSKDRVVILNQAGSGWNPIESTKYFSNSKILVVTRDPRDQFVEIKHYKKGKSVKDFIHWYNQMQERLKRIKIDNFININFEDFVYKYEKSVIELCKKLHLDSKIISTYNPELSKNNIGKYKKYLSDYEIDLFQKNLSQYFYNK